MNATAEESQEARDGMRRNMFLGALLRRGAEQAAVKIRNMSTLGALIDSPLVPEPNSPIELVRGPLVAHGRIVWSEPRRCGIRFNSKVSVNDWLAPLEGQPAHVPPRNRVSIVPPRTDRIEEPAPQEAPANDGDGDLQEIARLIDKVARRLASDPMFVRLHMTEARDLMRASQVMARLCAAAGKDPL